MQIPFALFVIRQHPTNHTRLPQAIIIDVLRREQKFAIIVITPRFIGRDTYEREYGLGFAKDDIHFLEGAVRGFRVEEVDDGEDKGAVSSNLRDL